MSVTIKDTTAHAIICGAVRYYMGRHTIAAHGVAYDLIKLIPQMTPKTKAVLDRDISHWLHENPFCTYGSVNDRAPWVLLRDALRDSEVVA